MLNSTDWKIVLVFSVKKTPTLQIEVTNAEIASESEKTRTPLLFKTLGRRWQCLEANRIQVCCVPSDNYIVVRVVLPQFFMAFY